MKPRSLLTLVIPLLAAALFVRLGVWQLSRLGERRAFNATLIARRESPPAPIRSLGADTADGRYRRVSATGAYVRGHEIAYGGRTHEGSPGVNILTPLSVAGTDTVIMVNRGWVYSADAATVNFARWPAPDSATVYGFAATYPEASRSAAAPPASPPASPPERGSRGAVLYRLNRGDIERAVGRPVAPFLLVQTSDSAARNDSTPVRLVMAPLDEGPHQSYAMQWFSFAAIAVIGGIALFLKGRKAA